MTLLPFSVITVNKIQRHMGSTNNAYILILLFVILGNSCRCPPITKGSENQSGFFLLWIFFTSSISLSCILHNGHREREQRGCAPFGQNWITFFAPTFVCVFCAASASAAVPSNLLGGIRIIEMEHVIREGWDTEMTEVQFDVKDVTEG